MPLTFRKSAGFQALALFLLVLVGFTVLAATKRNWFAAPTTATGQRQSATTEAAAAKPDRSVVQELLTLRPSGFDPAEITIPNGNFMLAIDNLTYLPDLNLTLAEDKKGKLKEIKIESKNRDWREEIDLKPGVYTLSEANHPRWTCRITVTDQVRGN